MPPKGIGSNSGQSLFCLRVHIKGRHASALIQRASYRVQTALADSGFTGFDICPKAAGLW